MRDLIKAGLVALVLSLSLAAPVTAGPFEDGSAAYERGDYATALMVYRPLADKGDAKAQYNLGIMYDTGQGVSQDYVQAHKWYNLSASRASADETDVRDSAVKNRDLVAAKMTPAQIAEAQRLASEWKPK